MPAFAFAFESLHSGSAADLDDGFQAFRRRMKASYNELVEDYQGRGTPGRRRFCGRDARGGI